MNGFNQAVIMGRLGDNPEVRYSQSGTAIANISVATSKAWKDKGSGEKKQKTEWHRVCLFGRTAEIAGEYLKKGSAVLVVGEIQTRKWQDQSGNDRYTTEIVASELQMLDSKPQSQHQGGYQQQQQRQPVSGTNAQQPNPRAPAPSDDFDLDVPF